MKEPYLLTYDDGEYYTYAWFETEEELREFINETIHVKPIDIIHIKDGELIKL